MFLISITSCVEDSLCPAGVTLTKRAFSLRVDKSEAPRYPMPERIPPARTLMSQMLNRLVPLGLRFPLLYSFLPKSVLRWPYLAAEPLSLPPNYPFPYTACSISHRSLIRPGASLQPAKRLPQMTASLKVNAFTISPDLEMPPSATMDDFDLRLWWKAAYKALICGIPTPATIRVVQIDPGPWPTLITFAPPR